MFLLVFYSLIFYYFQIFSAIASKNLFLLCFSIAFRFFRHIILILVNDCSTICICGVAYSCIAELPSCLLASFFLFTKYFHFQIWQGKQFFFFGKNITGEVFYDVKHRHIWYNLIEFPCYLKYSFIVLSLFL